MACTTTGVLLALAGLAAVTGLQMQDAGNDGPNEFDTLNDDDIDDDPMSREGVVAALDPELTRANGDKIHVTQRGEFMMIVIPKTFDASTMDVRTDAELVVKATFDNLTTQPCEDKMIREVTLEGSQLGENFTKMRFFIYDDTYSNSTTDVLGLEIGHVKRNSRGEITGINTYTYSDVLTPTNFIKPISFWSEHAPTCTLKRPRGYIKRPTKHSFRSRSTLFEAECTFSQGAANVRVFQIRWSSVWRGTQTVNGVEENVYANDLAFSVSNVGSAPGGLLGDDDETEATKKVQGCNKQQPISGPAQRKPKGKKWQHHWKHEKHD